MNLTHATAIAVGEGSTQTMLSLRGVLLVRSPKTGRTYDLASVLMRAQLNYREVNSELIPSLVTSIEAAAMWHGQSRYSQEELHQNFVVVSTVDEDLPY